MECCLPKQTHGHAPYYACMHTTCCLRQPTATHIDTATQRSWRRRVMTLLCTAMLAMLLSSMLATQHVYCALCCALMFSSGICRPRGCRNCILRSFSGLLSLFAASCASAKGCRGCFSVLLQMLPGGFHVCMYTPSPEPPVCAGASRWYWRAWWSQHTLSAHLQLGRGMIGRAVAAARCTAP